MAGKTWLELTNIVLRRLRENPVTTVSSSNYSAMIGQFVNEAKREVEDAWDWNRLRTTEVVATVPGTFSYTLTGLGKRFRVIDVFNISNPVQMQQIGSTAMNQLFLGAPATQRGAPFYYNFNGSTGGDPDVDLWPIPLAIYTINFNVVVPQDDFTLDATQLTVPDWPVIMGAWAKAISERGEDGGANFSETDGQYRGALADAIQQDVGFAPDEVIWQTA